MSDPRKYTIGWICAIATEFVAAQAFFDEGHENPEQVAQNDNNSYVLGRIGKHNVVVAVLPDGEYGSTPAAAVARDMLHTFPNVRIGLMVGIGGGAPSSEHDIRLGDIVISMCDGDKGAVIQYDFGKTVQNQSLQKTGFLNQPPTVLRTAVNALKARYEMNGHQLNENINIALKNIKKRKKYMRPLAISDRLYPSDFIHDTTQPICCSKAGSNISSHLLITRIGRDEEEDDPSIHYGLIASANQLMVDAQLRDRLAAEHGILCFETEAAGLMNHFPCLVIRGICDYSDSHKNQEWQGFAAMMAAAYAKDLLLQIQSNKVEAENRISETIGLLKESLENIQDNVYKARKIVEIGELSHHSRKIERWLAPPDPSTTINHAKKNRHQGTGTWFLNSLDFRDWSSGLRQYLWLYGLAGSGKTVLSTTVVDHLEQLAEADDHIILRFFFDFNDTTKQTLDGMLRSLAHQLYSRKVRSAGYLDSLFQAHQAGRTQPTTQALSHIVCKMLKDQQQVFIILDALDESTTRGELLTWIEDVSCSTELGHIQLMHTSRPEAEFTHRLPLLLGKDNCLELNKHEVNVDIRSYVTARLQHDSDFVCKGLSKDLFGQICDRVGDRAHGMFRWAVCQMDSLAKCPSPKAIKTALDELPEDLTETYERMLMHVPRELNTNAIRLLQFLVHSKRPLTLLEAVEVIATEIEEEPRHFDVDGRVFNKDEVLRYCPSLVSIVQVITQYGYKQEELHLAHFSVKEFLLKKDIFKATSANLIMTKTCLAYLTDIKGNDVEVRQNFPMARYAAEVWMDCAIMADEPDEIIEEAVHFLLSETTFQRWGRLYQPDKEWEDRPAAPTASRLYYACVKGLKATVRALLLHGVNVNAQGGRYGNSLQAASLGGHQEIVQQLLNQGADVNAQGGYYGNALQAASVRGHQEIVRQILNQGADANAQGGRYGNALQAASERGYQAIIQLLLNQGADANAQGGYYGNALQAASVGGHQEIVRQFLNQGADANAQGGRCGNALQAASEKGYQKILQLLLNQGADVNTQDGEYRNALRAASEIGHQEIVKLLLANGADANCRDELGRTPLFYASRFGHIDTVRLLIENDNTDHTITDWYGATPMFAAVRNGHFKVAELLLFSERGMIEARDGFGHDLTWWAHRTGNIEIVRLLLQYTKAGGVSTSNDGAYIDVVTTPSNNQLAWCDACTLTMPPGTGFSCEICCGGRFCICVECFQLGVQCDDSSHLLMAIDLLLGEESRIAGLGNQSSHAH